MSKLDPTIAGRISWMSNHTVQEIFANPELGQRMMNSYVGDSTYTGPVVPSRDALIDDHRRNTRRRFFDTRCLRRQIVHYVRPGCASNSQYSCCAGAT